MLIRYYLVEYPFILVVNIVNDYIVSIKSCLNRIICCDIHSNKQIFRIVGCNHWIGPSILLAAENLRFSRVLFSEINSFSFVDLIRLEICFSRFQNREFLISSSWEVKLIKMIVAIQFRKDKRGTSW